VALAAPSERRGRIAEGILEAAEALAAVSMEVDSA